MSGLRTDEALRGDQIAVDATLLRVAASGSWILAANEKLLFFLFLLTLPLANPWVRGDGVGYYAYLRSALIDHDLRFENDYLAANESFVISHVDAQGRLLPSLYTKTGYVDNHFSVGPAILWAPVLIAVHGTVLLADHFGAHVAADGYSRPYLLSMAFTTACYGFLSLFLAFRIARKYFGDPWTFLATVGIWMASSLPIYMYFNPSWSHALSAFTVALFLWYWERTRLQRTAGQWAILGLIGGLMGNVYYPNVILLIFPALEVVHLWLAKQRDPGRVMVPIQELAVSCGVFLVAFFAALFPTFLTRQIIYGNPFESGYPALSTWNWTSPALLKVLFSSDHGLFSWTPILILAVVGLAFLAKRDALLGAGCLLTFLAYYYFIASYPDWDGLSSFGNRFFVSLTPIFILGLAALLSSFSSWLGKTTRAVAIASPVLALLIAWNLGFIFQWGTHLVPARGEISWSTMVHNQVIDVPLRMTQALENYFIDRGEMMLHIEQEDIEQQKLEKPGE
ncbi:MAG: glycosyltransferase family 39 protein [Candidatus Acidiferrales bacterium]